MTTADPSGPKGPKGPSGPAHERDQFIPVRKADLLAALTSEASSQRGDSIMRAHSASEGASRGEDARERADVERADDTRPEPGSSARVGGAGS